MAIKKGIPYDRPQTNCIRAGLPGGDCCKLVKYNTTMRAIDEIRFDSNGLVPAVVQDWQSGQVLMVAYMNAESVARTLETGFATYWSRSRQRFWVKGETSGHVQRVKEMLLDCDADCLLLRVEQEGPACHEGYRSCFFRRVANKGDRVETIAETLKSMRDIYGA